MAGKCVAMCGKLPVMRIPARRAAHQADRDPCERRQRGGVALDPAGNCLHGNLPCGDGGDGNGTDRRHDGGRMLAKVGGQGCPGRSFCIITP
jgi:hypothetical protein